MPNAALAQIPKTYFGLSIFAVTNVSPWPSIPFGSSRLWDDCDTNGGSCSYPGGSNCSGTSTYTFWTALEASNGVYNWTSLDNIVATLKSKGVTNVTYTFGKVPGWANSNGGCAGVPSDFGASGSAYFNAFVTALVTHAVATYGAGFLIYEMWNEFNDSGSWLGTVAQMNTLVANAVPIIRSIDPTATILSPAPTGTGGPAAIGAFITNGGSTYFDQMAFHCYAWGTVPFPPEYLVAVFSYYSYELQAASLTSPLVCTEWDNSNGASGTASDPIYLSVGYILGSSSISQLSWYQFDNPNSPTFGNLQGTNQGLNPAGAAYRVMFSWLANSTWTSPPTRQAGSNAVRNPSFTGATAGTGITGTCGVGTAGTMPTNMNIQGTTTGLHTSVGTVSTFNGVTYIPYRVCGTAPGSANINFVFDSRAPTGAAQYWTCNVNASYVAGDYTNISSAAVVVQANDSGGSFISNMFNMNWVTPNALTIDKQTLWVPSTITPANTAYLQPAFVLYYGAGAIDVTFQLALPNCDSGTEWVGTLTRSNGANSVIVWDAANGANGALTYTTTLACGGSNCNYMRNITGSSYPVGSSVPLTNSPIILDTSAQAVRFN